MEDLKYPFFDVMNERYAQDARNNCINKMDAQQAKLIHK